MTGYTKQAGAPAPASPGRCWAHLQLPAADAHDAAHPDICWVQDKSFEMALYPPLEFELRPEVKKFY